MAKKIVAKVNKSELIRNLKAANPAAGPGELAALATKQVGEQVTPQYISTVLSQAKRKESNGATTPGKRGRKAGGPAVADLLETKRFAQSQGGAAAVRAALDTLDQLASV